MLTHYKLNVNPMKRVTRVISITIGCAMPKEFLEQKEFNKYLLSR
jgi:hypothetical protein